MGKLIKNEAVRLNEKELKPTKKTTLNLRDLEKSNPCENCYNTNFTPQRLDYLDLEDVVVSMIRNYKKNQYENIIHPGSMPQVDDDARSVHFSLNKLKSFIYDIESKCCSIDCKESLGELGIRFYYGAYNNTLPLQGGVDNAYAGKHTLVLVPTYTKDFGDENPPQNVDFCPDWFREGSCEPESLEQGGATYRDQAIMTQGAAQKKMAIPSKKIMALVGGFDNKEPKKVGNTKTATKKLAMARPGPGNTDNGGNQTVHSILNHGDLVPPPGKSPLGPPYRSATLLNC